jgi:hypothetical protein
MKMDPKPVLKSRIKGGKKCNNKEFICFEFHVSTTPSLDCAYKFDKTLIRFLPEQKYIIFDHQNPGSGSGFTNMDSKLD